MVVAIYACVGSFFCVVFNRDLARWTNKRSLLSPPSPHCSFFGFTHWEELNLES